MGTAITVKESAPPMRILVAMTLLALGDADLRMTSSAPAVSYATDMLTHTPTIPRTSASNVLGRGGVLLAKGRWTSMQRPEVLIQDFTSIDEAMTELGRRLEEEAQSWSGLIVGLAINVMFSHVLEGGDDEDRYEAALQERGHPDTNPRLHFTIKFS